MNTKANIQDSAHWLVSGNLLDKDLAEQVCASAAGKNQPLVKYLVEQELIESAAIAAVIARKFGFPVFDLDALDLHVMPVNLVDPKLIQKYRAIPLYKSGSVLFIGVSDPTEITALEVLKFHTDCKIEPVIVEESKLRQIIQELREQSMGVDSQQPGSNYLDIPAFDIENPGKAPEEEDNRVVDETPVMRFVNKMLMDGIRQQASDIHIEPYEHISRVRFREDGLLREITRPPPYFSRRICSRLKVMAKLDIAEKRIPQDGRFTLKISATRSIDFRVSTLPTLWGEKIVLRILDQLSARLDLDRLGFNQDQKQHFIEALNKKQGLILVTGPTGSGKSLTLYSGLSLLNSQERNISTAEDPVEIHLQGINQVAVNSAAGLNFTEALRAFLRQDPDILMVGEIRDLETAEIAVKASQTGHLVLSTLHTNSACETLSRLQDMGIAPYHLGSSLSLLIAQRLVRSLCNHCKKAVRLPDKVLIQEGFLPEQLANIKLYAASGCEKCVSGYKGRVGVYETVPITDAISRVIINGENSMQVAELARKSGFNTLRASALEKASQGLTSLEEVNRIT